MGGMLVFQVPTSNILWFDPGGSSDGGNLPFTRASSSDALEREGGPIPRGVDLAP